MKDKIRCPQPSMFDLHNSIEYENRRKTPEGEKVVLI